MADRSMRIYRRVPVLGTAHLRPYTGGHEDHPLRRVPGLAGLAARTAPVPGADHARGGGEAGRPPTRGSARSKRENGDWTSANTSPSARRSAATTRRACAGSPAQPLRRPARRGTGDTPDSTRRVRSPAFPEKTRRGTLSNSFLTRLHDYRIICLLAILLIM